MLTCVLLLFVFFFFFFKQKTAYEMRISDWSSDVCSSDLLLRLRRSYYESFAMAARGDPENCLKPYHRRSDVGTRHSFRHGQSGTVQLPQPDDTYCHRLSGRRRFGPSLARSEERRVGKGCVSPGRSRGLPFHYKKKQ